jgi:UDP-N-acetylglucosamine:LPS N-acetylglucosamine transferase
MLLPKGEADPETVAQAVETYLDSLQNQAQMAEMLHRSGQSEFAQSILDSMQKRMGY